MAKVYVKTITAGPYTKMVAYTRPYGWQPPKVREARQKESTAAQRWLNTNNATQRLEWKLWANFFDDSACYCTLTYAPENLPDTEAEMKKRIRAFMVLLRKAKAMAGKELKYIYSSEGVALDERPDAVPPESDWETCPWETQRWGEIGQIRKGKRKIWETPVRFHHHAFLLLTAAEFEVVRSLWPWGHVYIKKIRVTDKLSFKRLSAYTTKEQRYGISAVGKHSYICSRNLREPDIKTEWLEMRDVPMAAPDGCIRIDDSYGGSGEAQTWHVYLEYYKHQPITKDIRPVRRN